MKQSAVSHNSAESEKLSLDGGFTRKWSARASVLGLRNAERKWTPARRNARLKQDVSDSNFHSHAENCVSENIDHGPETHLHQSSTNSTLLDIAAVIQMIMKRTKPMLEARHKNARR